MNLTQLKQEARAEWEAGYGTTPDLKQHIFIDTILNKAVDAVEESVVPKEMEIRAEHYAAKDTYFHQANFFNLCCKQVAEAFNNFRGV